MSEDINWNGRTFGELSEEEKSVVIAKAVAKLKAELKANEAAITKILNSDD